MMTEAKNRKGLEKEEKEELQQRIFLLENLHNLQNEAYWRQQVLIQLERIANALSILSEEEKKFE